MLNAEQREKLFQMKIIKYVDAKALGISPSCLSYYAKRGVLERMAPGIYLNKKQELDVPAQWEELVGIIMSIPQGVVTGIPALSLYDITDEFVRRYWIAVPNNTSTGNHPLVKILRLRNHSLGVTKMKLGEVEIPIYDLERTIVDAFRFQTLEIGIKALQMAFQLPFGKRPDIHKLSEYSYELHYNLSPYIMALTT